MNAQVKNLYVNKPLHSLRNNLPVIIISSLTFVCGMAWNDAFKGLLDYYIPEQYKNSNNAWIKVIYAFVLTIGIIIFISNLVKYNILT